MKHLASLLLASCAMANDTAVHDGNDGAAPIGGKRGPESVIRMVRERLDTSFGKQKTDVHATFVFLNSKPDAPVHQTVGFPDRTKMAAQALADPFADEDAARVERLRASHSGGSSRLPHLATDGAEAEG